MVLLFHVTIALASMVYTTYLFVFPSQFKLRVSYGLVSLTLVSGTYLVLSTHAHMLSACMTGLLYIGAVSAGLAGARHRLASANVTDHTVDRDA